MKYLNPLLAITLLSFQANATTWHVGASQLYTMPSQVSTLVQDGDTVDIDAGIYPSDVAHWTANNLVLEGVNGMAQLPSGGLVYGGKAIWVISGNNTTVEYIDFSQAECVDLNGAGIRQEGSNLIVRHCLFHNNQEGILAGTVNPSNILIEYSEFADNGAGDGYSHNLYINHIDTLTFRYNYSHGALVGHELKSRANVNFILYNRISDELTGTASRSIDLPNGGTSYLIGNVIEQGPLTENSNIIGYGLEGLTNPSPNELYAINNTIVNNRVGGSFFDINSSSALFKAYNNIAAGSGSFVTGSPLIADMSANVFSISVDSLNFVNPVSYNYTLSDSSLLALNNGVNAGTANGISLTPTMQYVHPNEVTTRCAAGLIDIGAFELCDAINVVPDLKNKSMFYPNPTKGFIHFGVLQQKVSVKNVMGEIVLESINVTDIDLSGLVDGIYFVGYANGLQPIVIQSDR